MASLFNSKTNELLIYLKGIRRLQMDYIINYSDLFIDSDNKEVCEYILGLSEIDILQIKEIIEKDNKTQKWKIDLLETWENSKNETDEY